MTADAKARKAKTPMAAMLASAVAAGLLALAALELVLSIIAPLQTENAETGAGGQEARRFDPDRTALLTEDLFSLGGEEIFAPVEEDLPETTLRLTLKSATPSDGGISRAIIQTPDGKQSVFAVGEEVVRGVTLSDVQTWRVVITRNGRREALVLKNRPEIEASSLPVRQDAAETATAADIPDIGNVEIPDDIDERGASATLMALAGPLLPQLERQGFRGGDVPVAVNGEPIPSDEEGIAALLAAARSEPSVIVTVARDGRRRDIRLSLSQLTTP